MFTTDRNMTENAHSGGRHFELGVAHGLFLASQTLNLMGSNRWLRPIIPITVGPKENIFHYMPYIQNFPTWEEALEWLKKYKTEVEEMEAWIEIALKAGELTSGPDVVARNFNISKTVN